MVWPPLLMCSTGTCIHSSLSLCSDCLAAEQKEAGEREARLHAAEDKVAATKARVAAFNAALQEVGRRATSASTWLNYLCHAYIYSWPQPLASCL